MFVHVPDHFSSYLQVDFKKLPTKIVDRSSIIKSVLGCFLGIMLLGLGLFELYTFLSIESEKNSSLLTVEVFALIIIFIALGLIVFSILSLFRYKQIIFDGNIFTIIYHPTLGIQHQITEPLKNYTGVRFRSLFSQNGLLNKTRYIIDLYHPDNSKIIPLYISTDNHNIRRIWENYARLFKLPALSIGDRGLVQRAYEDLDKSLQELYHENKLPFIASGKFPAPDSLIIEETKNATIIEPASIFWDAFSALFLFISVLAMLLLIAGGVYLTILGTTLPMKYWAIGAILLFAATYFAAKLFKSYRLIIHRDSLTITETFLTTSLKEESISFAEIESIELSYNPTIDRYSIAIINDDRIITFGGRLPVSDLIWLRDFVIRKLIGN